MGLVEKRVARSARDTKGSRPAMQPRKRDSPRSEHFASSLLVPHASKPPNTTPTTVKGRGVTTWFRCHYDSSRSEVDDVSNDTSERDANDNKDAEDPRVEVANKSNKRNCLCALLAHA